jgi:hypothetical protein
MEQTDGGDADCQRLQISHLFAVALADADLPAGDLNDFLGVVHRAPPRMARQAGVIPAATNARRSSAIQR